MTIPEHDSLTPPEATFTTLLRMIRGFQETQMIYVAAQLGLADLLAEGARTSAELAAATGTHAPSLYRLLRALASLGIFAEDEQGRFSLTPMAQLLRKDVPNSLRSTTLYVGAPNFQQVWGDLLHSVTTGEDGFHHLFGMGAWEYREQNPQLNARFNEYMTEVSRLDAAAVAAAYDFSGIRTLVDIGGGQGSLIAAILRVNPSLLGIVFDQPHVVARAQTVLQAAGVAEHAQPVGGDFFAELPAGDAYILKSVIHDWDDEQSIRILTNSRRYLNPNGKILLVEYVIPTGNAPHPGKLSDINMLVAPGGQERTEAEYRALFEASGYRLERVLPLRTGRSIIEALPV